MAFTAPNSTVPSVWQIFSSSPLCSLYPKYLGYWINMPCTFTPLGPFYMLVPVPGMLALQMTICSAFYFLQIFTQLSIKSFLSSLSKINLFSHYPISPFPALFFPKHFSPSNHFYLFIHFIASCPSKCKLDGVSDFSIFNSTSISKAQWNQYLFNRFMSFHYAFVRT